MEFLIKIRSKSAPYLHEKFIYLIRKNKNSEFELVCNEAMWGGNILIGEHPENNLRF